MACLFFAFSDIVIAFGYQRAQDGSGLPAELAVELSDKPVEVRAPLLHRRPKQPVKARISNLQAEHVTSQGSDVFSECLSRRSFRRRVSP